MNRYFTTFLAFLTMSSLSFAEEDNLGNRLVEVATTFQEYDPFMPWQQTAPGVRRGYGVLVGNSRVLTTENLVRNHRLVELCAARSGEKISATVELSDPQVDLAILKIASDKAFAYALPVLIAESAATNGATVEILQFDETSQLQRGKAQVLHVAVSELPTAPYSSLIFSLLTDLSINGEGAPVISDNKLSGIVVSYDPAARVARMLPYPILRQFVDNSLNARYEGVASAGIIWTSLVDPAKRAYLQVPGNNGILVTSCLPDTGASKSLEPNDVVLEWNGRSLDNMGFYEDNEFGRLGFAYLIKGRSKPGDVVPVKIFRDRAEKTVSVRLDRWLDSASLIPGDVTGEQTEYLVDGGMIIRELTGRYLRAHGADWQQTTDPRLVHLYLTQKDAAEHLGEHVVILSGVLPDPINIGYQHLQDQVIININGKPIKNMKDVFRIVDTDGEVKRLTLQSIGVDVVLDRSELAEANARIAKLYRLPALRFQREEASVK
jgi:S1-C subfamily serine protease